MPSKNEPKKRPYSEVVKKSKDRRYQKKRRERYSDLGLIPKTLSIDSKTNDLIEKISQCLGFDTTKDREKTRRESAVVFYAVRKLAFDLGLLDKMYAINDEADLYTYFMRTICAQLKNNGTPKDKTPQTSKEVVEALNESRFIKVSDVSEDEDSQWDLASVRKVMAEDSGLQQLKKKK